MTQSRRIFLFAAFAATLYLLGVPAALHAQSLHVTSFPDGANVLNDGKDTGKVTPMSVSLTAGTTYTVPVQLSNLTGWNVDNQTVTIASGDNCLSVTLLPILTTGPPGPQGPPGPAGSRQASASLDHKGLPEPQVQPGRKGLLESTTKARGTRRRITRAMLSLVLARAGLQQRPIQIPSR